MTGWKNYQLREIKEKIGHGLLPYYMHSKLNEEYGR